MKMSEGALMGTQVLFRQVLLLPWVTRATRGTPQQNQEVQTMLQAGASRDTANIPIAPSVHLPTDSSFAAGIYKIHKLGLVGGRVLCQAKEWAPTVVWVSFLTTETPPWRSFSFFLFWDVLIQWPRSSQKPSPAPVKAGRGVWGWTPC